jgi:hypothetical protein
MVHEPNIRFECENCSEVVEFELEWVFTDYSGKNGYYTAEATSQSVSLEIRLQTEHGWEVNDKKEHFCNVCSEKLARTKITKETRVIQ